ncbi:putative DNA binding domain-containing protein [Candidatus Poribacteria bacterium]|nr:putative DNA binding domain-containing protein [Candidatus Poribacteria bacterium]
MAEAIKKRIAQGESQTVEFKASLQLGNEIGETISAFANTDGGVLWIGISDDRKILGVSLGRKTLEDFANRVKENTDPPIYPDVTVHQVDSKDIIRISIKENDEKPVFFKDRAFQRVGKTNQRISASRIRELAKQERVKLNWDERICEGATLEEIDEEKVKWYLIRREEMRQVKKPEEMAVKTLLINLKAASEVNGKALLTHAGVLFFAKNPQRFILQSQLRLVRFAGRTLTRDFLDRTDCAGTLWELVNQSEDFIRRNIRLFGFRTEFTFRRIDKPEYPLRAIREGLLNALIHRSYSEPADTRVLIFDDRIEIVNPGSFPKGVTPEDPRHVPIHPVLCQLMYDVGFIEKYGTGIYMMKALCEEHGIPEPEYELNERETKLTFRTGGKAVLLSEIERLGIELNDRQKEALKLALREGFITNKRYRELHQISDEMARKELKEVVEKGVLKVVGQGRATKYVPVGD